MIISAKGGVFGPWHDYKVILPCEFINCKDAFGYEGFKITVEDDKGYKVPLRIVEANLLKVKYKDKIYDMRKPKEYLTLKSILESEIVLASLD